MNEDYDNMNIIIEKIIPSHKLYYYASCCEYLAIHFDKIFKQKLEIRSQTQKYDENLSVYQQQIEFYIKQSIKYHVLSAKEGNCNSIDKLKNIDEMYDNKLEETSFYLIDLDENYCTNKIYDYKKIYTNIGYGFFI